MQILVTFRAAVLGGLLVIISAVAALADITGSYYAYGRNADGSAYEGTVNIVDTGNGVFTVNWQVGNAYSGTGALDGRVFEVNWGDETPATYVLMPNGELHGTWGNGMGLEALTRTPR